jgi:DNA-binding transcriptional LysR family regulator
MASITVDHLTALRMFVRVVEARSFSAVGRELGVAQSVVSRNVAALESELSAKLLSRTTRMVSPTEAGQALYARVSVALRDIDEVESEVRQGSKALAGLVRIAVPGAIGRRLLLPTIARFLEAHPAVRVEVDVGDRLVNLTEFGADFAVRVGRPSEGTLAVRSLARSPQVIVASPQYLVRRGVPTKLEDLASHDLVLRRTGTSGNPLARAAPLLGRLVARVQSDDIETAWGVVREGAGIGVLPLWLVADDLASGRVQRVLTEVSLPMGELVVVFPSENKPSARARVLIEMIATELQARFASVTESPPSSRKNGRRVG